MSTKDSEIRFRAEDQLVEAVTAAAELNEQGVSEFCREALLEHLKNQAKPTGDGVQCCAVLPQGLHQDMDTLTRVSGKPISEFIVSGLENMRRMNSDVLLSVRDMFATHPEYDETRDLRALFYQWQRSGRFGKR